MALISRMSAPPLKTVFISSFVPRECGIATFAEDVINAVSGHNVGCKVVAMNRPGQQLAYDRRVMMTVQEDRLPDYLAAAAAINRGRYDVLSVQHEFGIFGGVECNHLATFLEMIEIPVVTTFHTILKEPSPVMRRNLRAVANRSDAIVVMNSLAVELLDKVYGVDVKRVHVVHHGAPEVQAGRRHTIKNDLKLKGRKIISTFGLLSSGKGLEYAIQAMPRIVNAHPDALYLVLGQTHPIIKQQEGEKYRDLLKSLAADAGISEQVVFVDKYFTKAELVAYLLATDVYLTPYLNMEQITSGTLAYAMACGRPLVSTPYLYAQFLLGEDRGLLVQPRDPDSIAEACLRILDNPEIKARMESTNWTYGRQMLWPQVGKEYSHIFHRLTTAPVASASYLPARAT
ncbi:MAG: glycosyltransferase family 4 protein [Armatimonadota bacterium]